MSVMADYVGFNHARENLKPILDRARDGHLVTIGRGADVAAVLDGDALRALLAPLVPNRPEVIFEDGVVAVVLPGIPVATEAASVDEAAEDMVDALRDYADDWDDHLLHAPNHAGNSALVNLIRLSTDEQLRDWLLGNEQLPTGEPR